MVSHQYEMAGGSARRRVPGVLDEILRESGLHSPRDQRVGARISQIVSISEFYDSERPRANPGTAVVLVCYAVSTRPGNLTLREPFAIASAVFCMACSGTKFRPPLLDCPGVLASFSSSVGLMNPAARRVSSARVSTPNLLNSDDTWNFTVRTVIFNRDAISLFARLLTTASSTSLCRALNDVGQAIARPSFSSSSVRNVSLATRDCSAGTST